MQPSPAPKDLTILAQAKRPLLIGYAALFVLVGCLGLWSTQAKIAGAIIVSGTVQVEHSRQVLQHPTGGVIRDLLVRDGDTVKAGDVVLRFDDSLQNTELQILKTRWTETRARKARLTAERDGANHIEFGEHLNTLADSDTGVRTLLAGHIDLFHERQRALAQEGLQLDTQITQTREQIIGTTAQLTSIETQFKLSIQDLNVLSGLFDKGLAQATRVSALQQKQAQLLGQVGQLKAQIAQLNGDIARLETAKLHLITSLREGAMTELRELATQDAELTERLLALQDALSKMEVRATISGIIHDSQVFSEHSVVNPAAPIMYIVPQDQPLVIKVRVRASDIDQLHIGQSASLQFTSFEQSTLPEITGAVVKISADVFHDEQARQSFYTAELVLNDHAKAVLNDRPMRPGMPVEAFLKTSERSPLNYLLKPVSIYFSRAMRES